MQQQDNKASGNRWSSFSRAPLSIDETDRWDFLVGHVLRSEADLPPEWARKSAEHESRCGPHLESQSRCSSSYTSLPCAEVVRRSANTTDRVSVPTSEHVAEIVGRQGCKIKELRHRTNTYIRTPARNEDPIFLVTGRENDVRRARMEIEAAARHFSLLRANRKQSNSNNNSSSSGSGNNNNNNSGNNNNSNGINSSNNTGEERRGESQNKKRQQR